MTATHPSQSVTGCKATATHEKCTWASICGRVQPHRATPTTLERTETVSGDRGTKIFSLRVVDLTPPRGLHGAAAARWWWDDGAIESRRANMMSQSETAERRSQQTWHIAHVQGVLLLVSIHL